MEQERKKILVIENQNFQYKEIIGYLKSNNFQYYPDIKDNYVEFIDHVRVWVNKEYEHNDYRKRSFSYIYDVMQKGFDLILMDHILGGAYHCLTGIDFARALNLKRKEENKKYIPVVFLSKTESNEENRLKQYDEYKADFPDTSVWVHKGYFGDEILNETYFNECVVKEINRLISTPQENSKYVNFFEERLVIAQKLNKPEDNVSENEEIETLKLLIPALKETRIDTNHEEVNNLLKRIEFNIRNGCSNSENYQIIKDFIK